MDISYQFPLLSTSHYFPTTNEMLGKKLFIFFCAEAGPIQLKMRCYLYWSGQEDLVFRWSTNLPHFWPLKWQITFFSGTFSIHSWQTIFFRTSLALSTVERLEVAPSLGALLGPGCKPSVSLTIINTSSLTSGMQQTISWRSISSVFTLLRSQYLIVMYHNNIRGKLSTH